MRLRSLVGGLIIPIAMWAQISGRLWELGKADLDLDGKNDTIYVQAAPSPTVGIDRVRDPVIDCDATVSVKIKGKIQKVGVIHSITELGLVREFVAYNNSEDRQVIRRFVILQAKRGSALSYWGLGFVHEELRLFSIPSELMEGLS